MVKMVKHRPSMTSELANKSDLIDILSWLEREYKEDGEGFWGNRRIIKRSFKDGDLWVMRENGVAVAFQVGHYATDILCVRKDRQRRGFGTAMFKASLVRAMKDNLNVLKGECSPPSSLPFWQRQGFVRYNDPTGHGRITVRKVLQREHDVPDRLPQVEVVISFFPEKVLYRKNVTALDVVHLVGGEESNGAVKLPQRVIGLADDEPEKGDLVVKIVVNGAERCFCKAKYDEAKMVGVQRQSRGNTFYIDEISPTKG